MASSAASQLARSSLAHSENSAGTSASPYISFSHSPTNSPLFNGKPCPPDALSSVAGAWEAGTRYYDTAPWYGKGLSEQRLGLGLVSAAALPFARALLSSRCCTAQLSERGVPRDDEGRALSAPRRPRGRGRREHGPEHAAHERRVFVRTLPALWHRTDSSGKSSWTRNCALWQTSV